VGWEGGGDGGDGCVVELLRPVRDNIHVNI